MENMMILETILPLVMALHVVTFECSVGYYDFSDKGYGADEDGVFFSVSASL